MVIGEQRDRLVCEHCHRVHFPDVNADGVQVLDAESALGCPLCSVKLVHATIGGATLLYCANCRGLLITMELFVSLVDHLSRQAARPAALPTPPPPEQLERELYCPSCGRRMHTHRYGGPGNIIIDNCARCGLNWLDYPELRRVSSASGLGSA